jgi:hypothetical protein
MVIAAGEERIAHWAVRVNCAKMLAGKRGGMASFAGSRAGADAVCGC